MVVKLLQKIIIIKPKIVFKLITHLKTQSLKTNVSPSRIINGKKRRKKNSNNLKHVY